VLVRNRYKSGEKTLVLLHAKVCKMSIKMHFSKLCEERILKLNIKPNKQINTFYKINTEPVLSKHMHNTSNIM